jgi:ABC-2 type transport system ATP-binding protein
VAEGEPEQLKGELRGDAISIELQDLESNGRVNHALGRLSEVRDVAVDGRSLRARADDGARAVPIVLQTLEASGVRVSSVTVARPSLDDVYLRYTGRTISQAEQQTPEGDANEKKEARR